VLSAGSDGVIETSITQSVINPAVNGDDMVGRIT
jgi:hypothetical protein